MEEGDGLEAAGAARTESKRLNAGCVETAGAERETGTGITAALGTAQQFIVQKVGAGWGDMAVSAEANNRKC